MSGITIALIGAGATTLVGILTFIGVIITNKNSNDRLNNEIHHHLETSQAITDTKIEELTREVREHNGFARRMPVIEEQIKGINHRLKVLEHDNEK